MLFAQPWFQPFLGCLVILCVIWRPTEILISKVLSMFPIEIKKDESGCNDTERKASTEKALKAGKYIGFLERVIVVVLVMLNAPTAIGFVLTAKSVARFKQLEDQSFAERYLVGTLLSVGIALVTVLLIPKIYPFI